MASNSQGTADIEGAGTGTEQPLTDAGDGAQASGSAQVTDSGLAGGSQVAADSADLGVTGVGMTLRWGRQLGPPAWNSAVNRPKSSKPGHSNTDRQQASDDSRLQQGSKQVITTAAEVHRPYRQQSVDDMLSMHDDDDYATFATDRRRYTTDRRVGNLVESDSDHDSVYHDSGEHNGDKYTGYEDDYDDFVQREVSRSQRYRQLHSRPLSPPRRTTDRSGHHLVLSPKKKNRYEEVNLIDLSPDRRRLTDRYSRPVNGDRRTDRSPRIQPMDRKTDFRQMHRSLPQRKFIKPERFIPPAPIESYLSHFETIAEYNQWDECDKAAHLKAALGSSAAQILWDSTDCKLMNYSDVVAKLRSRFGADNHRDRYAAQLRLLRRRQGQGLQELYNEVCRLMALAYPENQRTPLYNSTACECFILALNDKELESKVRDRDPQTLDEAYSASIKCEGNMQLMNGTKSYQFKRQDELQRSRQVLKTGNSDQQTDTYVLIQQLQQQLEDSKKQYDELFQQVEQLKTATGKSSSFKGSKSQQNKGNFNANSQSGNSQRPQRNCYTCGESSHLARDCPKKNAPEINQAETSAPAVSRNMRDTDGRRLDRTAYLQVRIRRKKLKVLLDTGSEINLFPAKFANLPMTESRSLVAANGTEIRVTGMARIPCQIGEKTVTVSGYCSPNLSEIILGLAFLQENKVKWDFDSGEISILGQNHRLFDRQISGRCRRIILEESVEAPPRAEVVIPTYIQYGGSPRSTGEWATVPRQLAPHVHVARVLLPHRSCEIPIRVVNTGDRPFVIPAGTVAEVEEVDVDKDSVIDSPITVEEENRIIDQMVQTVDASVSEQEKDVLSAILHEYSKAFSFHDLDIGCAVGLKHHIDTTGAQPVRQRLRRQAPEHQRAADEHITNLLKQDIIEPAQSPWAANIVMVKKQSSNEWRMCIDWRGLNDVTKKDAYSLPRIDDCLDALSGAVYFSTCDLKSSYFQVQLDDESKEKTAFISRRGQFQMKRLGMGLTNSGSCFQRLIDITLTGLSYDICLSYIDDIIVYSVSLTQHFDRLKVVLQRLINSGLKIKCSKAFFCRKSVSFLGHLISEEGIQAHPNKTEQILNWGRPRNARDVRAFLGITGYYRRFVKAYAQLAAPLTALLSKNVKFCWTPECESAFVDLKRALAQPPILSMPRQEGQYILDTDSSFFAMGSVLSQVQDGQVRVIAYASRRLSPRERNYCTTRKELLAVVNYLKYFRPYLLGASQPVRIRTDHAALVWLRNLAEPVGQQARWLETMEEYDYTIEHRSGALHSNADMLSRDPRHDGKCCPSTNDPQNGSKHAKEYPIASLHHVARNESERMSKSGDTVDDLIVFDVNKITVQPIGAEFVGIQDEIARTQKEDQSLGPIYVAIENKLPQPTWDWVQRYSEETKALWRQWAQLYIVNNLLVRLFEQADGKEAFYQVILPRSLRQEFLVKIHAGIGGGHLGRHKTELAVRARAYWPGWHENVRQSVKQCVACAQFTRGQAPKQTFLKPILTGQPWEILALDITGPHPVSSQGHQYILTMQDNFSKWTEAFPIRRHTAPVVAKILFNEIFCRFGCPYRLLTDLGAEFESDIMHELCRLMCIDKIRCTVYRPQANGQLERFHRTLNSMIAKVVADNHRDWHEHIPGILAAYRATTHESTGFTANRLVLGREIKLPIDIAYGVDVDIGPLNSVTSSEEFVTNLTDRLASDFTLVRENLNKNAEVRKNRYDVKVKPQTFQVNDRVWYWNPRKYSNRSPKWQKRYTGPFSVIRILNEYLAVISKSRKAKPFTVNMDKLKLVLNDPCEQPVIPDGVAAPAMAENLHEADDQFMQQRPKRAINKPKFMNDYCCRCVETIAFRNRRVISSDDDCADQDVGPQVPQDQPTQRRRKRRLQSTFLGRPRKSPAGIRQCHSCPHLAGYTFRDAYNFYIHSKSRVHATHLVGRSTSSPARGGASSSQQQHRERSQRADSRPCMRVGRVRGAERLPPIEPEDAGDRRRVPCRQSRRRTVISESDVGDGDSSAMDESVLSTDKRDVGTQTCATGVVHSVAAQTESTLSVCRFCTCYVRPSESEAASASVLPASPEIASNAFDEFAPSPCRILPLTFNDSFHFSDIDAMEPTALSSPNHR